MGGLVGRGTQSACALERVTDGEWRTEMGMRKAEGLPLGWLMETDDRFVILERA